MDTRTTLPGTPDHGGLTDPRTCVYSAASREREREGLGRVRVWVNTTININQYINT